MLVRRYSVFVSSSTHVLLLLVFLVFFHAFIFFVIVFAMGVIIAVCSATLFLHLGVAFIVDHRLNKLAFMHVLEYVLLGRGNQQ